MRESRTSYTPMLCCERVPFLFFHDAFSTTEMNSPFSCTETNSDRQEGQPLKYPFNHRSSARAPAISVVTESPVMLYQCTLSATSGIIASTFCALKAAVNRSTVSRGDWAKAVANAPTHIAAMVEHFTAVRPRANPAPEPLVVFSFAVLRASSGNLSACWPPPAHPIRCAKSSRPTCAIRS